MRRPSSLKESPRYAQAMGLFLQGATVLPCDGQQATLSANIHVEGGLIAGCLSPDAPVPAGADVIDLEGHFLLPGFVQTHTHLVQSLFQSSDELLMTVAGKTVTALAAGTADVNVMFGSDNIGTP